MLVDSEDTPGHAFATATGLTTSNAGVRLFRARRALKARVARSCGTCADDGRLDCTGGAPASSRPA